MTKYITEPPYDTYDLSTFVATNDTVYIGHFGGFCGSDGSILETIEEQFTQTLSNLEKALKNSHLSLHHVVKMTVILKDINDFKGMHSVWTQFFKEGRYPVRTVITSDFVSEHCLVQIDGIAHY